MTHAKPVRIVFMVLISLVVVSLCGCKKHGSSEPEATRPATDTTALIVMQATRCARLYTTEYKIHKVVTHEDVRRLKGRILSIPVDRNSCFAAADRQIHIYRNEIGRAHV